MKYSDMGIVIAKYLRETNKLKEEHINLSDYQIGELVFNDDKRGELWPFYAWYQEAKDYFALKENTIQEDKNE